MSRTKDGLTRSFHDVHTIALGGTTSFEDGVLTVGDDASHSLADPALAEVRLSVVSPGDNARIIKILDTVEPRAKEGPGLFPGFLGPQGLQGTGTTHVLRGAAVVTAGYLPRAQEGLVDMTGPAQPMSFLGRTHNVVIEFSPREGAPWEEVDIALRRAGLKLAEYLARAAFGAPPDDTHELPSLGEHGTAGLPRVAAITNLQTQGTFKDVFVYGKSFSGEPPVLLDANELEDGAVVSGQFGHPALKNPTFAHQNHPVAGALRRRHGIDLDFAGVVICPEPVDQKGKERTAAEVVQLCKDAGLDAVVITKEGGGNADGDISLKMDALEDAGIKAVGLFAEMAGSDGSGAPLVIAPNKATAMVSTGNYDHVLKLPSMERSLGGEEFALLKVPATSELSVPAAVVYCSLSPLGLGHLTCAEVG